LRRPSRTGPAYPRSGWSPDGWFPAASESPRARYQPSPGAAEVDVSAGRGAGVDEGGGVVMVARMPSGPLGSGAAPEHPDNPRATAAAAAAARRRPTGPACQTAYARMP
jgi:hypothetical protein